MSRRGLGISSTQVGRINRGRGRKTERLLRERERERGAVI